MTERCTDPECAGHSCSSSTTNLRLDRFQQRVLCFEHLTALHQCGDLLFLYISEGDTRTVECRDAFDRILQSLTELHCVHLSSTEACCG